jgi:branched-chain amino acid transport system substrate-binding protein
MRKLMVNTPGLEQTPLMGGDSLNTSAFVAAPGAMSGGPVYSTVAVADASKNPAATSFTAQYKTSYGPLGAYSASSYDSTEILLNAIKAVIQAGTKVPANSNDADTARVFRQAVIDQVALTVYSGITGEQSFDANGDTTNKTITIYQLTTASGSLAWKYVTKKTPMP